jgi:dimethylglycine dehydrogenase
MPVQETPVLHDLHDGSKVDAATGTSTDASSGMKTSARVVVIGGGVVGASVLYHLTKAGWTDVVLLERKELTHGSTWHAAGGMHTLNGDPNVAKLQQYTVQLYKTIEAESGQNCSIHLPGGIMLADTPERLDWLKMAQARGRYLGMGLEMISLKEASEIHPLLDPQYFLGCLYDPDEGHVDPSGVTHAYAMCARNAGAEVYRHTMVEDLTQRTDGTWNVHTNKGTIHAEHVVNAGGLWAREVGRMVGIELPVLAFEHMYLLTDDMPEIVEYRNKHGKELPMSVDFAGESYFRQEGDSMLLGSYEYNCVPWSPKQTPWEFGAQLLTPDLDRLEKPLSIAFEHYPRLQEIGIKRVINGPFTFAPDGNPLVGPVRGLRNFWTACGVMAGLSQGGGVGLALAAWMTQGDPGMDIWGMDVARYGDYATLGYTAEKAKENYQRRFRIQFPNEELPAGRPLHMTPVYGRQNDANAVWGASFGLEYPLWFQEPGKEPIEDVTFKRSNAFKVVGDECRAVRESVGLTEVSNFAKYEIKGPGAEAWLSSLLTNKMPKVGKIVLSALLNHHGRIEGEFTVARLGEEHFFLFGSMPAEIHHSRWFLHHLPTDGSVTFAVRGLGLTGLSIAGPNARKVLAKITDADVSNEAFPFMSFRQIECGMIPAMVGRLTYSGDLGYELWVPPEYQIALFDRIMAAGAEYGIRLFGLRALLSLRLEKSFGTWYREYRPIYTPVEAGITSYVKLDHDFIGREAYEAEVAKGPDRRLVTFVVDVDPNDPADVIGDEPVWHTAADGTASVVGWITSGGYGHYVGKSIALGYIPAALAAEGTRGFEIEIIGERRPATLQHEPLLDPKGSRMRS